MAVKLRLRRMGKKKQPIYKIVAADSRSPRDGKYIEAVGLYNPLTNPHTIDLKEDRALYWLGVGAQPTETVKSLLNQKGVLLKRELLKKGLSENEVNTQMESWSKSKGQKAKPAAKKAEAKPVETKKEEKANTDSETNSTSEEMGAASEEKAAE